MTTGVEHYKAAERELRQAADSSIDDGTAGYYLAKAQVHATLALAAATATQLTSHFIELDEDAFAWNEVSGTPPRGIEDVHLPQVAP